MTPQRALAFVGSVLIVIMFASACGGGEVRDEVATIPPRPTFVPPPPTSTLVPDVGGVSASSETDAEVDETESAAAAPSATVPPASPTPEPSPTARRTPPPTVTPTAIALPAPRATEIQPIPTAVPTPRPQPTATPAPPPPATPVPRPTPVPPRPTATPIPRPTAVPQRTNAAGIPVIEVGCNVSSRSIQAGQVISLQATQDPLGPDVRYAWDHGDGTVDRQPLSQAQYNRPGTYALTLFWALGGSQGSIPCGTVTVSAAPAAPSAPSISSGTSSSDFLGLSESGAVQLAAQRGFSFVRVARRDGTVYPPLVDRRSDRVNIEVDSGRVTSVAFG